MDFSFIIPVYNCKKWLRDCIESILSTNLSSLEIILIDDGSTDGSSELCDALKKEHPTVKVIHQKNAGVSAARNTGLKASSGSLVLFFDADDSIDSLELQSILTDIRCLEADLTIFGLSFDYYHRNRCYRRDSLFFSYSGIMSADFWQAHMIQLFMHNSISPLWNKVFRRDIIEANHLSLNTGMFLYEDLEFVLQYLSCCDQVWNVPKAVYHYRQSEDEGNAGRRLARITSIPDFLVPIENALENLAKKRPGVCKSDCEKILQSLHLTLAREKISVSSLSVIRHICKDYAQWEKNRIQAPDDSPFRKQLLSERAFTLWFRDKYIKLRHRIAVFLKFILYQVRKGANRHG